MLHSFFEVLVLVSKVSGYGLAAMSNSLLCAQTVQAHWLCAIDPGSSLGCLGRGQSVGTPPQISNSPKFVYDEPSPQVLSKMSSVRLFCG